VFTSYPAAGTRLSASTLQALVSELRPVSAIKTADESLTSNAVLQDDDHLSVAFGSSLTYTIVGELYVDGPTAGDINLRLAWTGTVTRLDWGARGLATTATTAEGDTRSVAQLGATTSPATAISMGTITANFSVIELGGLLIPSTTGVLTLQWAQSVSTGTATTVRLGSWLKLIPSA
jgi:hypothetical protein